MFVAIDIDSIITTTFVSSSIFLILYVSRDMITGREKKKTKIDDDEFLQMPILFDLFVH